MKHQAKGSSLNDVGLKVFRMPSVIAAGKIDLSPNTHVYVISLSIKVNDYLFYDQIFFFEIL